VKAGDAAPAGGPTVSAVIPVFDGEAFVADAIASVLAQTHPVAECIVVDDGSTDATAEVVRRFGGAVRLIQQPNAGVAAARNRGAEAATGRFVAFLDADDAWAPAKLERQLAAAARLPATGLVLCDLELFDEDTGATLGRAAMHPGPGTLLDMVLFEGAQTVSCSSTALLERALFERMGGFDVALSMSADWDFLARALLEGPVASVPEPLVRYRVHGANMSRNVTLLERDMTRAYAKLFARGDLPADVRRSRRRAEANLHRMLAGSYFARRAPAGFVRNTARSLVRDPSVFRYFLAFPVRKLRARHKGTETHERERGAGAV
jgi:glycosyltransferase involved in cell wall biosynthesis